MVERTLIEPVEGTAPVRRDGPVDVDRMAPAELQAVVRWLGYEPPAEMGPRDIAAATALVRALPGDALAAALHPGASVDFSTPLGGLAVPGVLPAGGGQSFVAGGQVSLSDVRTGPGGERSQVLEMSVETTSQYGAHVGRTDLNRLYRYGERFDALPQGVRDWVGSLSPAGQWAVRGPDFRGSAEFSSFSGGRLSYEAVVPPELGARIAAGDLSAAPNPLQPLTMPVGASVVMRGEAMEGTSFAAAYRMVRGQETLTELNGQGFSVRRLEGDVVEVTSGPVSAVERDAFLGVGLSVLNVGIGRDDRLSSEQLQVARMDLGTPEGQEAYRLFMQSGSVPDRAGPGIPMAGARDQLSYESQTSARLNIGPVSMSATLADTSYENTVTRWGDGSAEHRVSGDAFNGNRFEITSTLRPDGSVDPGSRTWQATLHNLHPASASYLQTAFTGAEYNGDMPRGTALDVSFRDADLMRMRDMAREELGRINPGALAHIDARAGSPHLERTPDAGSMLQRMAAAQTPEEVFRASFLAPTASTGQLAETLITLSAGASTPDRFVTVPGSATLRDAEMRTVFQHDGRAPAAAVDTPAVPATPPADPRLPTDPDHALYRQASEAVSRLDASLGRSPDDASAALAASLTVLAREQGMRIDHVMLSAGNGTVGHGENVIIVEGDPNDPARRTASMPTPEAVRTPVDESFGRLDEIRRTEAQATPTPAPATPVVETPTVDTPELAVAAQRR